MWCRMHHVREGVKSKEKKEGNSFTLGNNVQHFAQDRMDIIKALTYSMMLSHASARDGDHVCFHIGVLCVTESLPERKSAAAKAHPCLCSFPRLEWPHHI